MAPALRVSEAAAMALHTIAFLAAAKQPLQTTGELASQLSGSAAHLSKVLQRLTKAGLIQSVRGPKGGFGLARPADSINLLEVWEAIDGPVGDCNCLQNPPVCKGTTCVFGQLMIQVNQLVREYLGQTTLSQLRLERRQLLRQGSTKTKAKAKP